MWVWSLGQEDPLKKGMATYSSILAWGRPWTDEQRLWSIRSQKSQTCEHAYTHAEILTSHFLLVPWELKMKCVLKRLVNHKWHKSELSQTPGMTTYEGGGGHYWGLLASALLLCFVVAAWIDLQHSWRVVSLGLEFLVSNSFFFF